MADEPIAWEFIVNNWGWILGGLVVVVLVYLFARPYEDNEERPWPDDPDDQDGRNE